MAEQVTVEQAVERAMLAQNARIEAIRGLANARQTLADVTAEAARRAAELERENAEKIGAAERDDLQSYNAATKAGWTADELRKIGFEAPVKTRRAARSKRGAMRIERSGGRTDQASAESSAG